MGNSSVLVTGGTGFLGSQIVARLAAEGYAVTVLGRNPPAEDGGRTRFVRASLDDVRAVSAACAGMEAVYHTAAKVGVWGAYADFYRTNVLGTRAVLDGCRAHGVQRLIYSSTPSVVFNGLDLAGADESLPLTTDCPSAYALTKAIAEREVLAANCVGLRTIALRPHLIWGVGDPHLVPRLLARARAGRLRIVGDGQNRVDMVHVTNAVDAHVQAHAALRSSDSADSKGKNVRRADGRAFFVSNGEPVVLWHWINELLQALGERPVTKRISLRSASLLGAACEALWHTFPVGGEPPMTRFVAAELAKDHWFDISAARRDLGYEPRVSMAEGMAELVTSLRRGQTNAGC